VDGDDQDIFLFMLAEALIHLKVSTISKIRQGSDCTRVRCKMNQEIKARESVKLGPVLYELHDDYEFPKNQY
jgi:hypothetical protein